MKTGSIILLCLCWVLMIQCSKPENNSNMPDKHSISGKTYIFTVNRESNLPSVQFPNSELKESDYTPIAEPIQHRVLFTDEGNRIIINPGEVRGTYRESSSWSINYQLNEGLFAGGRFIIWKNSGKLHAEYTRFGSGVPIARSERGMLEPSE